MDCPKCNADMEILDYSDESGDTWVTREWECRCPDCGYHGKYCEFFKFDDSEWERMNE